jgi:replicative DNA helicase
MSSIKCGITQIDKHLDGFNYGEMIISASRAGHGNFYFITSIVRGICYSAKDTAVKGILFDNCG